MSYESKTIASVVNLLNVRYFLPAFQREFVWKPEQVLQLFDAIFCSYPTGSLLFWELTDENRSTYQVYKFISKFQQGGTHNQSATTDGVHELTLVIDGQQRLTSFLIGLKGTYILKKKFGRVDNSDAYTSHELYLDLLQMPREAGEQNENGLRYGFHFFAKEPVSAEGHCWFRVGKIMDFDTEQRFETHLEGFIDHSSDIHTKGQTNTIRKHLTRLYQMVWKEESVAFYTEKQQDYDRVLDIFIRANDGGTKLSKSDLLMSVITSHWKGINAREEIFGCMDRLNSELTRKNRFDKDFIMKTCFVVCDLPVTYKVSNFTNSNLAIIRDNWSGLKQAMENATDLANSSGIDEQNMTSANALIPIIYFLFHNPGKTLRTSTPYDVRNASIVRRWLIMMLLNRVFGTHGDIIQTEARDVLKQHLGSETDFPAHEINEALRLAGKSPSFDSYDMKRFFEIEYSSRECFLALSLLYEEKGWGTMTYQLDHIFPQSLFRGRHLLDMGIDYMKQVRYRELSNRIGNLQLLLTSENAGKSDQDFGDWLKTRDAGFREKHLIPKEDGLLDLECFEEFIEAREALIRERLKQILPA